ncbi:MAG: S1 RNA-binding domain-containing protein [Thermotogae bacterium]|nr:S1 RNA-binding domain-containing protein [Thermotogota bacterium]
MLIYEKPLSPEEVIRRAEVWEEIFKAKDGRRPLKVVINRHVRDDIYEVLYRDTVKGLLKSPKRHEVGEEVEALVVISDYTTKTFRTRLYDPSEILTPGDVVEGRVKKVTSSGGFVVLVGNQQCIVPKRHLGKAVKYPLRDLKRGKVICRVLRVSGKRPVLKILDVKI